VTDARDVDGARNDIFDCIRRYRDRKIIYFHDWNGFGAAPVLRSIAQLLTSTKTKKTPELFYDRIIYVDCSEWISKRAMQRKIAEELELDHETMAMFDKHDEEDDLNGLEYSSRDVIRSVSQVIARTLGSTSFMMIFLNGSDDEVDINKFGISPDYNEHVVLWTFKRQLLTTHGWLRIAGNLSSFPLDISGSSLLVRWDPRSFASPPFLKCHKLRFLGVDHCIDKKTSNEDESTMEWAFLHKLWVLYIYYTPWDKITRLDKIDLMTNLRELNIVGFCCWQYTSILQGRVPNLQRLRIIEPKQMAETSTYSDSGGSSLMENTKLEVLDLSGNRNMKNLPTSLSKASNLQMLILDGCVGLEKVVVSNSRLPSTLKLFSFDGYGPALCQPSAIELPLMENLFIRGMPYLMELDLSGSAIKRESSCLQLYAILADARLARSLRPLMHWDACFYMHITSTKYVGAAGPGLEAHSKEIIEPNDQQHHDPANPYGSIFTEIIGDTPLGAFPQPPTQQLDCHIEISDGSLGLESELADSDRDNSLAYIMKSFVKSLHMHDVSASASLPDGTWNNLRWCRIERCPNMDTVFPPSVIDIGDQLEVVWALHLLTARSIWSKGLRTYPCFGNLQDLHLCSCPRLQFVMPVWVPSLPSLKTIHIVHCSELRHIFLLEGRYPEQIVIHGLPFPKLTTIHLYNLPSLQQICEVKMLTPALETVMIRGCFGLRRLPALEGREPGVKKPTVEMEKDVWDALEWEGLVANHQSDLYEVTPESGINCCYDRSVARLLLMVYFVHVVCA
ncbi:hypothetical protein EJB05_03223, partial [Eragrostis curvula]